MYTCVYVYIHIHMYIPSHTYGSHTRMHTQMSDKADEFVGALAVVVHGPSEQAQPDLISDFPPTASRSLMDGDEFEDTIEAEGPDDSLFRGGRAPFRVSVCTVCVCVCVRIRD